MSDSLLLEQFVNGVGTMGVFIKTTNLSAFLSSQEVALMASILFVSKHIFNPS